MNKSKGETVTYPKHLAIAELLEVGGGGRGSGPEPDWDSRRLVSVARRRSNELREAHPDWLARKCDRQAAEEYKEQARQYSVLNPVGWMLERLKHNPWGRKRKYKYRPKRKGKPA